MQNVEYGEATTSSQLAIKMEFDGFEHFCMVRGEACGDAQAHIHQVRPAWSPSGPGTGHAGGGKADDSVAVFRLAV